MYDNHLLIIGFDAEDVGDFAWFQGVLLQIFDVTNPQAPALIDRTVIGTRGSSSDATGDHLAFTYFPTKGWLAIPMAICEGGAGGGCFNWWQNPNSQVKRSIFIEDYVYSLSGTRLKVNAVADLATDLVSQSLPKTEVVREPVCYWD
jgi:uncharacterized secreted protein with C-terminal beta-propeller domain